MAPIGKVHGFGWPGEEGETSRTAWVIQSLDARKSTKKVGDKYSGLRGLPGSSGCSGFLSLESPIGG